MVFQLEQSIHQADDCRTGRGEQTRKSLMDKIGSLGFQVILQLGEDDRDVRILNGKGFLTLFSILQNTGCTGLKTKTR